MFGNRRRRGSSTPPVNPANVNPSAQSAAAQAFLRSQSSNASLSAAAAAAALRSRPTTPISVGEVQTKRMIRRSGSTSSMGSSVAGSSRPTLERRGSSGSMSERTFRDPSPSQPVPSAIDAPPVPAIPANIPQSNSHRRTASLESPSMRVASPRPNKATGRGTSLGPGTTPTPPRRAGQRMSSLSNVQELTSVDRPVSRGSVNFSYPTSSRPTSPVSQRQLTFRSSSRNNTPRIDSATNHNMVYDPNTRSFLPLAEILAIEQRLRDAANQPVKKKKRIAPAQSTGTHLSDGTVGGRIRGTAVDAMEEAARSKVGEQPAAVTVPTPKPAPATLPTPPPEPTYIPTAPAITTASRSTPKKKKKKVVVMSDDSESDQGSYMPNSSDNDSDFRSNFNTRAGAMLAKKPSIVREDKEGEEEAQFEHGTGAETRNISPSPLPRSTAGRGLGHGRGQASASAAYAQGRQQSRSASQPAPSISTPATNGDGLGANGSVRGGRVQSVSPARTTHFATSPDSLQVKHQPPPRSISPRKSALKHHSRSPRGESPAGEIPGSFDHSKRASISETSNASDDVPIPRKKANRVSFDESNVMVGEAAPQMSTDSPIAASPQQAKRSWFSLGRGKKKDADVVEEDDEVMKPRPALPMFGSIRERKATREPEERQLVKPAEYTEKSESALIEAPAPVSTLTKAVASPPTSPMFTSPTGESIDFPMGQSNDHVVGAIFSQDAAFKNAANISRSREPLPPEVLSVEGSGYHSDTDSTISALSNSDIGIIQPVESSPKFPIDKLQKDEIPDSEEDEPLSPSKTNGDVPEIAITQPTPNLETVDARNEWPDMPGGFPSNSTESESGSQADERGPVIAEHHATDPSPAAVGIAEPFEGAQPGSPVLGDIAAENHLRDSTIFEETEDDSIYSDAAEDLSDLEGDGFMSLDAVVESPVVISNVPGLAISTPPDSPTAKSTKEKAYQTSQLSRKSSAPDMDEGWEKAQAYWKGLSTDKKRRLEQEAREEAEDSESTVEAKPQAKPKQKKKVTVKPSPVEVITLQQPKQPVRHDRGGYMIQPGSKAEKDGYNPVIRSSMRQEPSTTDETHIRKSMRGQGSMRGSLREDSEPKRALQKQTRPASLPISGIQSDPAAVRTHIRALSAASAAAASRNMATPIPATSPTLRRKGSGDSESSFKRTRPTGESRFRSSMRKGSEDYTANGRQQSPVNSSRFSLRSLSPTGSTAGRRPFNAQKPLTQTHMRGSMRSSYDSAPSLRGNKPDRAKSPLRKIPGFGRSSPTKAGKAKAVPRRASRFADSSDEDDARPAFRSRFVDSSDDDDEPLPPKTTGMRGSMRANQSVRGIPRRPGVNDGDSSDLPDSDDEKSPSSPGLKLAKNRPNGATSKKEGQILASGSLRRSGSGRETMASPIEPVRPKQTRRGSLMSILGRKKKDPSSKVRKSDIESAARRDTPLERSRSDLQAVRRQESYNSSTAGRPSTPKLQKRNPDITTTWPLSNSPPKIVGGEDGRPFTADTGDGVVGGEFTNGNGEAGRPELGTRRFTATGLGDVDLSTITAGRKKKKFSALRRMFRLDD